jgi:hypothetical protein
MKETFQVLDAAALLLFASVYVGTGVTLVFFLYPISPKLRPDTYRLPFVEPVKAATKLFTIMTMLMLVGSSALVVTEWGSYYLALPAVYLLLTITATLLTTRYIFRYNAAMDAGINDPDELQRTLTAWRRLNSYRASLWALEWSSITAWFVLRALSS